MNDVARGDGRCAVDTSCTSTVIHVRKSVGFFLALKKTTENGLNYGTSVFSLLIWLHYKINAFTSGSPVSLYLSKGGLRRGLFDRFIQKCRRWELKNRPDIYTSGTDAPSI